MCFDDWLSVIYENMMMKKKFSLSFRVAKLNLIYEKDLLIDRLIIAAICTRICTGRRCYSI